MQTLPASAHKRIPWKNGLGISQTIAGEPSGAGFDQLIWQVSSTGIVADCPFSELPQLDRQFMVMTGKGVELRSVDEHGAVHTGRVLPLEPAHAFHGDWKTTCRLLDGPVRVFNVMTRRGKAKASVELHSGASFRKAAGETVVVVDLPSLEAWIATGPDEESCPLPTASSQRALVRIRA
jgi:uncharacterized protein